MTRIHLGALVWLVAACGALDLHAARLRSPWDLSDVKLTDASYACPEPAHLSPDLATDGFYSDRKSSIIDPAKMKAYAASSGPYKRLGDEAVNAADAYRTTGSRAAAQCVLNLLSTAAADGVFTGKMSSRQAYYVQGWVIGAAAIAYLKIRDSGVVQPQSHAALAAWMKSVARQTIDFYAAAKPSGEAGNNHLYWAGVEIAAIAIATDDRNLFDWAVATYKNGVQQITPDGNLPLEMRRGQRALHYHLYAIAPLVYLAEFGKDNGIDLFGENDFALKRLVDRSIAGLNGSGYFDQQSDVPQDTPKGPPTAEEISWARIYVHHFPDPVISNLLAEATSLSYMYLGGLPPY
ncbi:alginate lyase family protein [Telmatobacter sp. DSM 110680]|uniref:Alginate lyase family protein n=1 Tax=Telmatobacter sp. DSM 110680 TaxID=3036704 RepID=A0AAU7DP75_9BACT